MLRAALASLLALASVWVGPVAQPIDEYNDTFQRGRHAPGDTDRPWNLGGLPTLSFVAFAWSSSPPLRL